MSNGNSVSIRGEQMKQLLTRFYYRDNHLHYQVLIEFANGKTVVIKEFADYATYKKVFGELQRIRRDNLSIRVPQQILKNIF